MSTFPQTPLPVDPAPADDPSARAACIRAIIGDLRVVFRTIQAHSRWVEKQCGVSAAQLWAMWELESAPGLRVSELSHALSIHSSTASNLLDKLELKGLVKRERGGTDQRVVRLYLTEEGAALLNQAPRPAQGALSGALQLLPDEALGDLRHGLDGLVDAMAIKDNSAALQPLSDG